MNWLRKRKVSPLPIPATPSMVAATLLDKVQQGQVESCLVMIKYVGGTYNCSYTTMTTADFLMHEKALQKLAMDAFEGSNA